MLSKLFDGLKSIISGVGVGTYNPAIFGGYTPPSSDFNYNKEAGQRFDNGVVFANINFISRVWPEAPLCVKEAKANTEGQFDLIPDHEMLEVIDNPNPWYNGDVLWFGVILSLIAAGNAYWLKVRHETTQQVIGLLYIPHTSIWPMNDQNNDDKTLLITYYQYTDSVSGLTKRLEVEDVVHFRWGIDPAWPAMGLSPVFAVLREIVGDNLASTYLSALLRNMGVPGIIFAPKGNVGAMKPDQRKTLKTLWRDFTRDKTGQPFVVPVAVDVVKASMSPKDLELSKRFDIPVGRICSVIGIDPMVLGLPSETKTYANLAIAMNAAYKLNIIPTKTMLAKQLDRQLLIDFDFKGKKTGWDYTEVAALQDDQDALWNRATTGFVSGVTTRAESKRVINNEFVKVDDARDNVYFTDLQFGGFEATEEDKKAHYANIMKILYQRGIDNHDKWVDIQIDELEKNMNAIGNKIEDLN
jgi:HK97 family phage portal protein